MNTSSPPRKIYCLVLLSLALSLMALPVSAYISAQSAGETAQEIFPYFSLELIERGNFLLIASGILTLAVTVMFLLPEKLKLKRPMILCLSPAILLSPLSWLIYNTFTMPSLFIVVFQALALLFIIIVKYPIPEENDEDEEMDFFP